MIHHRPTFAEIDLIALRHNVNEIMKRLPPGMQIMAVVKANAYGHGAPMCARTLKNLNVQNLAVATVEEGMELRNSGIKGEIYVFNGLLTDHPDELIEFRLKPVLHCLEEIRRLGSFLKKADKVMNVHLKLDTGMGRLGFLPSQTDELLQELAQNKKIKVEGILTHLARADEEDPAPTERQLVLFDRMRKIFSEKGFVVSFSHLANSAAIIDGKTDETRLVRPGIILYGAYPHPRHRDKIALKPVMSLKTRIMAVKKHPPGTALSYGGTFVTQRESVIAVLPLGYADGYPRLVSNRGSVLVRGRRASVVGRVCMDLTLVDVTDIPEAVLGDEVILFGSQGDEKIAVEEVAGWAETISYEILCGISARVPRIYRGM